MRNTLDQRFDHARNALNKVDVALARHNGLLDPDVETQFKTITAFAADVEHWKQMLEARQTARELLLGLELRVTHDDNVPYGVTTAKFQTVRLLGVQAYLAAQWALADRLVGMAGQVFCIRSTLQDPKSPPQLVSHFVGGKGPESKIAAITFNSVRKAFGWPIAVSYAIRNHFLHDGAGGDFFEGPKAISAFKVSKNGWKRIEERVKEYNVQRCFRMPQLDFQAGADLRDILDACAPQIDDALGVLVGTACQIMIAHVGFMVGED